MNSSAGIEEQIKELYGVIEAAVFDDASGNPVEIQVWTRAGTSEKDVRQGVSRILANEGKLQTNERLYVFELSGGLVEAPRHPRVPIPRSVVPPNIEDVTDLEEEIKRRSSGKPGAPRARIAKISLVSAEEGSHATVNLVMGDRESEGEGSGPKTEYSLRITAATTLEAAQAFLGQKSIFTLQGISLIEVMNERMVVVLVHTTLGGGRSLLGATLVGDSQVYETAVKATLDAVNRQLELATTNG